MKLSTHQIFLNRKAFACLALAQGTGRKENWFMLRQILLIS